MYRNYAKLSGVPEMEEKQRNKRYVLRKLFFASLYLSTFTFGGGYVIVTLLKEKFVDQYHWIDEEEMLDLVAIAQSAPGPIAVNGAIVVGYKLAGLTGTLVAIIGTIIPPFVIISLISAFFSCFSSFSCIFFAITLLIGANGLNGTVRSTSFTGILVILYPLEIQKDTKTSPYHTQENND